jgi:hypothetical protein
VGGTEKRKTKDGHQPFSISLTKIINLNLKSYIKKDDRGLVIA